MVEKVKGGTVPPLLSWRPIASALEILSGLGFVFPEPEADDGGEERRDDPEPEGGFPAPFIGEHPGEDPGHSGPDVAEEVDKAGG